MVRDKGRHIQYARMVKKRKKKFGNMQELCVHACRSMHAEREREVAYRNRENRRINLRHADIIKAQEGPTFVSLEAFGFRFFFNYLHLLLGTQGSSLPESHNCPIENHQMSKSKYEVEFF